MNLETPLAVVALGLPADTAALIMWEPQNRQTAVLTVIRRCMWEWETKGVVLDPLSLSVVLTSLVRELLGLFHGIIEHLEGS